MKYEINVYKGVNDAGEPDFTVIRHSYFETEMIYAHLSCSLSNEYYITVIEIDRTNITTKLKDGYNSGSITWREHLLNIVRANLNLGE